MIPCTAFFAHVLRLWNWYLTSDWDALLCSSPLLLSSAAVTDLGRADGGVAGPHAGSLPNWFQPHDAQRQPVVHPVPGSW